MRRQVDPLNWPQRLLFPAIDFATLGSFIVVTPWIGERLASPSAFNHLLLLPGFLMIVAGTIAIRKLPSYSLDEEKDPSLLGVCLVFFLLICYLLLYAHSTNIGGGPKNNEGIVIILFFVLLVPVLGSFCVPVERTRVGTGAALTSECIALLSVNYLSLIGAGVWDYFSSMPTGENPVYATGIWFLILFAILYLLFLAFFGLPRIYLFRATGDRLGLTFYLLGVAIFLWDKVPPVN